MDFIQQSFTVNFQYKVFFTEDLFHKSNKTFKYFLKENSKNNLKQKILFVIDTEVEAHHSNIVKQIDEYFQDSNEVQLIEEKLIIQGGEIVKNDESFYKKVIDAVNKYGVDRHSYIAVIGGGALLDMVGFAAAVSHRGIKLIRIPTTVLAQNDSGVGVKNSINYVGKKNFLGTFVPPCVVFNDFQYLTTLNYDHWKAGISEAIKVALIRDTIFFEWIETNATLLQKRNKPAMQYLIKRCAALHMEHISSGDPFEKGSSRPLDFGHWSAHKLEQISNFEVLHGYAVAIGIALDSIYSNLTNRLSKANTIRIINVLLKIGLPIFHPLLSPSEQKNPILKGLEEFREHLGGRLTIMLLKDIGKGEEVHEMNEDIILEAVKQLKNWSY